MERKPAWAGATLIHSAGALWKPATTSPFLDALAAGNLPAEVFRRWLAQDYLFARDLMAFQAILLAKVPRDCHKPLLAGMAALDSELDWFEEHAGRLRLDLNIAAHPTCRRYSDFLLRCAYEQPYPVLLAILFGVEVSYLAAWSALEPVGPYAEFIERWSGSAFADYVAALRSLAERYPHEAAQEFFNQVLQHERDFWQMSWGNCQVS